MTALGVLLPHVASAQLYVPLKPMSSQYRISTLQKSMMLPSISVDSVLATDKKDGSEQKGYRIGAAIPFDLDLLKQGQWDTVAAGRVCRLALNVPGAIATCINYSDFWMPSGATFFVYNPAAESELRGAFTELNNAKDRYFATGFVRGEDVVLEYFEPVDSKTSGSVKIGSIVHTFRGVPQLSRGNGPGGVASPTIFGDALPCHINVNCPPGLPYRDQARSVVMISYDQQIRAGSGALINNVRQNQIPYILTAGHMYTGDTAVNKWMFYFNYAQPQCDITHDGNLYQNPLGASLKAYGELGFESDFALLQLVNSVPPSFNAYFAGWNKVDAPADSTFCVHHPAGDVKKISFDRSQPTSSGPLPSNYFGNTHWAVTYHPNLGTGLIEGGTSGAPLFDQNRRIIGQHTTGVNDPGLCSWSEQRATFGKFAKAWSTYSSLPSKQLKYWLDPDNTGATTLNGYDPNPYCCVGMTGNLDGDPSEGVDISDLSWMISYLYNYGPPPVCWGEGNCDGDPLQTIDISDFTRLIDYLFISFEPLANCQ
jgi:hypothetical protein